MQTCRMKLLVAVAVALLVSQVSAHLRSFLPQRPHQCARPPTPSCLAHPLARTGLCGHRGPAHFQHWWTHCLLQVQRQDGKLPASARRSRVRVLPHRHHGAEWRLGLLPGAASCPRVLQGPCAPACQTIAPLAAPSRLPAPGTRQAEQETYATYDPTPESSTLAVHVSTFRLMEPVSMVTVGRADSESVVITGGSQPGAPSR